MKCNKKTNRKSFKQKRRRQITFLIFRWPRRILRGIFRWFNEIDCLLDETLQIVILSYAKIVSIDYLQKGVENDFIPCGLWSLSNRKGLHFCFWWIIIYWKQMRWKGWNTYYPLTHFPLFVFSSSLKRYIGRFETQEIIALLMFAKKLFLCYVTFLISIYTEPVVSAQLFLRFLAVESWIWNIICAYNVTLFWIRLFICLLFMPINAQT